MYCMSDVLVPFVALMSVFVGIIMGTYIGQKSLIKQMKEAGIIKKIQGGKK